MPTPAELKSAQEMLKFFRGDRVLAVTITHADWMRQTDLGALSRRTDEMRAIDQALKDYHDGGKNQGAFVRLKSAFDNWARAHQRAGKPWTQSDRNRSGAVTRLHDQITLVEGGRSVGAMGNTRDWEARQEIVKAERASLNTLFKGKTLVFKTVVKPRLAVVGTPAISGGIAIGKMATSGLSPVNARSIAGACTEILGSQPPEALFVALGSSFAGFCASASTILGAAVAPAKLLADIVKAGLAVNNRLEVSKNRYMFRPGSADAALDAVVQLIDAELALIAKDAAQAAASIAGAAFGVAPILAVANACIDVMVNLKLYKIMVEEMAAGNTLLANRTLGLELFSASPVLGCYFLIMADTSTWINFSVHDIGTPGWMDTVETMRKRAEPVRDKARSLIRASKYALSGTEGFNGLEWEPVWSRNKMEYLANLASVEGIAGMIENKVRA